jgi:hypothetical protein
MRVAAAIRYERDLFPHGQRQLGDSVNHKPPNKMRILSPKMSFATKITTRQKAPKAKPSPTAWRECNDKP